MKHKTFLKGAAVMTFGSLLSKLIGAAYRIPLTGFLGGYGTGLYQMAYPLFLLFLTFSSAGIPSALSKAVAGERALGRSGESVVKTALPLFALIGLTGTLLMCLFAPFMSVLQGDRSLVACYLALAPSVFFVAVISVLRGYFQGKSEMSATAFSEIVEQMFKAGAGLLFVARFPDEPVRAATCALGAVTVSELFALVYLLRRYRGERRAVTLKKTTRSAILSAVVPVMLSAALLPLSRTADSILVVRLMSRYTRRAVSLYGLLSGGAAALIDLPASLACGFVAAAIPSVSAAVARGDREGGRRNAAYALLLTFALSVPCALGLFFFAKPIVRLLYGTLVQEDAATLVSLVRLTSVSAVSLAAVNTLSACLTGMGRARYAAYSMAVAVTVKFALQWALVRNPALGIGGAAIASNACYLVAFFLDSWYTWKKTTGRDKRDNNHRFGNGKRRSHASRAESVEECGQGDLAQRGIAVRRKLERGRNRV